MHLETEIKSPVSVIDQRSDLRRSTRFGEVELENENSKGEKSGG